MDHILYTDTDEFIIGESYGFHDGAKAVININGYIVFAEQTERLSGIKHDKSRYPATYDGTHVYYEKPRLKQIRQWIAGQEITPKPSHDHYVSHHWSHAAASYYTRPYPEEPVCVVIDSIGEFDTASIWYKKKKVWSLKYPISLGLFYSSVTKILMGTPNRDEHLTMALAALGEVHPILLQRFEEQLQTNLHQGFDFKVFEIDGNFRPADIAATAQHLLETEILKIMKIARKYSPYLCYGGGVALNCVANTKVHKLFDDVWIFPNPGDAGAALGCAAAYLDKSLRFRNNYLGTTILRDLNPKEVANHLFKHGICGVANGSAEFGPRALGNRSLLADIRSPDAIDRVYQIKNRRYWSPLAPAILSEFFDVYYEGPMNEHMSFVCKSKTDILAHKDGTARVQVVYPTCSSPIRKILEEWYELTKIPLLCNTSLNLKHRPMINSIGQIENLEKTHAIKIF